MHQQQSSHNWNKNAIDAMHKKVREMWQIGNDNKKNANTINSFISCIGIKYL